MGRTIAALCAVIAAVLVSGAARGVAALPALGLHPGDNLAYDLSMEVQVHGQPLPHSTQPPYTIDTTVQGSEKITVLRADPDGSLHASMNVAFGVKSNGQSTPIQRVTLVKIAPDQSITVERGGDSSMAQYFSVISQAQKAYVGRTLHVGDVINQSVNVPGNFPVTVTTSAKVVAEKTYRGYPTFAIQVTGSAPVDVPVQSNRMKGKMTIAGTNYFDQKDQLFVGSAARVNLDATVAGPQGGHLTMVETVNVVLKSFTHGPAPLPVPTPSAMPSAVSSPSGTPTPSPTPTSGYYTPPPPSPTPSPYKTPLRG
jgi:hypothetical protein